MIMAFLETVIALFIKYGLVGLLFSSFISSLFFFPAYSTFLIPVYIKLHFNPWYILAVLTIGTVAGELVNYYIGYTGSKYIYRKEIKKAEEWLNKWGEMSVFLINLIPVLPADFVNLFVGFLRMDFKMFVVGMSLAKLIQFALLIFGTELFFNYVSLF